VISEDLGIKLESVELAQLGQAKQIEITKDSCTLIEGAGKTDALQARVAQIRGQLEKTESEYDREKYQERLAKLTGGVAIISVGAATETEMKQTKARMEDALHATRAAVEEGILPGGGVALLRSIEAVEKVKGKNDDEKIGINIVARALEGPIRQIAENCGTELTGSKGYNANTGEYVDMFKAGIIDPAKVVKNALKNAASIAGLMLTTQVLITRSDSTEGKKLANVEGSVR